MKPERPTHEPSPGPFDADDAHDAQTARSPSSSPSSPSGRNQEVRRAKNAGHSLPESPESLESPVLAVDDVSPSTDAGASHAPAPLSSLRLLTLLCLALPLVAYVAVGSFRYSQIRAETELRLDRSLRIAQEHALKVFDTDETVIDRVMDAVATSEPSSLRLRERVLRDQLSGIVAGKPQLQFIRVLDAQGRLLVSDGGTPLEPIEQQAQRALAQVHQGPGQDLYFDEPRSRTAAEGNQHFTMSRPITRADGSLAGVVVLGMPVEEFSRFHGELAADEPGLSITLFKSDGVVLSRVPLVPGTPTRIALNGPVLSRVLAGEMEGKVSGRSSIDARQRMAAFSRVGGYPLYLGIGMDVSEIWRRWLQEMAWLAGFGLPPMLGLYFAARIAMRRTRVSLETAARLQSEMQARRRVEEALLQAQKLEALGRLTGGVAHDFNNALMVVSSNLYLLRRRHPEVAGRYADSIARAVESATKLTRQLLAFSRRQALVLEQIDPRDRITGMRDLLMPVLGARITLELHAEPDTRPILVDAAELELALINLAINARDAMQGTGTFRVSARNALELPPHAPEAPMVLIEATDTGPGIEPELIAKVFEPFFTTKPLGQGTGLGLSQVYGLCQRAGGVATIDSRPGQGTSVRLYFPAQESRADATPLEEPTGRLHVGQSILLVEDNDEVAAALQPMLEALGCTVRRFEGAAPALDWLESHTPPQVLLSDVVMPGAMDGAQLAEQVRHRFPGMRILLMTGYAEQIDAIQARGFEVLPKPCSVSMLAEALSRAPMGGVRAG